MLHVVLESAVNCWSASDQRSQPPFKRAEERAESRAEMRGEDGVLRRGEADICLRVKKIRDKKGAFKKH